MALTTDFLPVPENNSDTTLQDILGAGQPNYPTPPQAANMQVAQGASLRDIFNAPTSLSTQLEGQTFDWNRSGADRYVHNRNYSTVGFDPFLPAETINGKAYDANEIKYGHLQTWWDVTKNAVAGAGALAWGAAVNNISSWGHTLNALYDFASGQGLAKAHQDFMGTPEELQVANDKQNAIMNKYAIYHTPEGDNGFFNKEFIGNSVQQLGFTVGTAAEMLGEMWLTAGIAEAFAPARMANLYVRAGKGIGAAEEATEFVKGAQATASRADAVNGIRQALDAQWDNNLVGSLWEGAKKFVPFSGVAGDLSAAKAAGASSRYLASIGVSGIGRTLSSFNAAKAEAMMESANTYGQLYGDLLNQYQDKHDGQLPQGDELKRIMDNSYHAATDNFIVNTGLLSVMNQLEFGNFMNKFSSSKRLLREAAEAGEKDVFTVTGALKGTGEKATRAYEKGRFGLFSDFTNVKKDFGLGTALWQVGKEIPKTQAAKFEVLEGIQELLQNTSDQAFRDYYTTMYNGSEDISGNSIFSDIGNVDFQKAWQEQNSGIDGMKTFLMGAVTGLFLSPLSGIAMKGRQAVLAKTSENYRDQQAKGKAERTENVNMLNAFYQDPMNYLNPVLEGIKVQGKAAQNITEAVQNGDPYEFNNAKDTALAKAAAVAIKTGNFDSFLATIKEAGDKYTPEEFEKAFNMPATSENKLNVKEFTKKIADQLESYYTTWQNLTDKYGDLVLPELHVKDPKEYADALIAKRALQESIEILATNSMLSAKTLERMVSIESDLAKIPNIGNSATQAVRILSNRSYTANKITELREDIKSMDGLPGKEIAEQRKVKEQQLDHLEKWLQGFDNHQKLTNATEDIYKDKDFTKVFVANREQMMDSYKDYINSLNKETGNSTVINDRDVEAAFKSTADYIALKRDHGQYVEAMNVLTDPKNFVKLYGKISNAIHAARVNLYTEHMKEQEGTPKEETTPEQQGETIPFEETTNEPTPDTTTTTPEETAATEPVPQPTPEPQKGPDYETLRQDAKDFFIAPTVETPDDLYHEPEMSNELAAYLKGEGKELANKIRSIQSLYKKDSARRDGLISTAIDEHFDSKVVPEATTASSTTNEPIKEGTGRKLYRLGDVTRIYPIENRELYKKFDVQPTEDGKFSVTDNRKDTPVTKIYDTETLAREAVGNFVRRAAQLELDKLLRNTPASAISDGLSLQIIPGPNRGGNPIVINDHLTQNREHWTMALSYGGAPIAFVSNPNQFTITFDGKEVAIPDLTVEQFMKVFNVEGRDPVEALNTFKLNYQKGQLLSTGIETLMKGKTNLTISGEDLSNLIDITPVSGDYDFLNGDKAQFRPTIQQTVDSGKELVAVYDNRTERVIYGDGSNLPQIPEFLDANNRALFRLPNGDTRWVEASGKLYTPQELTDVVTRLDAKSKDIKELNNYLADIFISLNPGAPKVGIRVTDKGFPQVVLRTDTGKYYLTLNAGIKNKETPAVFNGNVSAFITRMNSEVNHKLKKLGLPEVNITEGNFRHNFSQDPTEEEIMGMQIGVSTNIMKNYHLEYIPKAPIGYADSIPEPSESTSVEIIGADENGNDIIGTDISSLMDPEDIAKEVSTPQDALAVIRQRKEQMNKASAKKIVTPSVNFNLQSVEHIDRFTEFLTNNLPEFVNLEDLGTLTHNLKEQNVTVGDFITNLDGLRPVGGTIRVYKNTPYKYHEAFHAVFRLLLPQQKVDQLLSEAAKEVQVTPAKLQEFRDLHPLYSQLGEKELTDLYLEEYMADKFNAWILNKSTPTHYSIKGFFAKLLDLIRSIWDRLSGSQMRGLFSDISKGAYKNAKLQNNQFTDISVSTPAMKVIKIGDQLFTDANGRVIKTPRNLPQQEADQLSSTIAALFVQEADSSPSYNKNAILDTILDNYKELLDPERDMYMTKAASMNKPDMVRYLTRLDDLHTVFSDPTARASLKEAVDEQLRLMNFRQDLADDSLQERVERDTQGAKGFDSYADATGGYDVLDKDIKLYIGSTTRPYIDEFGNSTFLNGQPLIQAVNPGYVYNGLLQTIAGATSDNDVVHKLWAYKDDNGDTGAFIRRLIADTNLTMDDTGKWAITRKAPLFQSFLNSFKQFATNPLFARIDPSKKVVEVFNANRQNSARMQFTTWAQAFNATYMPRLMGLKEQGDIRKRKEIVNSAFKPLFDISDQFSNADKSAKGITDEQLQLLAQRVSNSLKENLGISLSPLFLKYSVAKGKVDSVRTDSQKALVNAYKGTYALTADDIQGLYNSLAAGDNLFARKEGEREGASSRLIKIAEGNSIFDERVWSMSYIGPDGERRWGYQLPTFNRLQVQKMNNPIFLEELKGSADHNNFLLDSEHFLEMSNQGKLRVEDVSGIRQVFFDVDKETGELSVDNRLDTNKIEGVAFGDMTSREFEVFSLSSYGADGGIIQDGPGKEDNFYSTPIVLRIMAESATANMVRMPVIKAVNNNGGLSTEAIDILYSLVEKDFDRIRRTQQEIDSLPATELITDYHNGKLRGLQLSNTRDMLGNLVAGIENGARGLDTDGNPLTKEYTLNKASIAKQLQDYWKEHMNQYVDSLAEQGVIDKKGNKVTNKLLPGFFFDGFGNSIRNEKMNLKEGDFTHNIRQVYMNDYLNRVGITQLLYGDESKAFKGAIDATRRMKGGNGAGKSMAFSVTAPELGIEHPLSTFHRVLIPEPLYTGRSGANKEKADAQMYMTPKALRYMLFGFGKLSKVQADIIDEIVKGNPVAESMFIKAGGLQRKIDAFGSYKVVYFDGNVHLKCSAVTLTKELTSFNDNGTWRPWPGMEDLHHLRESMEAFEQRMEAAGTPTISYASPMTASKGVNKAVVPGTRNIEDSYFQQLGAENMRLQSETPSNKLTMTDPTGLKFNVLVEQDESALAPWLDKSIGDVMKDYLSDSAKRITNSNYQVINSIFRRTDGTPIQLGDRINSRDITPDMGRLYDYMRRIQEATGTDSQTLALFETENGQPVYDLNNPATLQKFTQMVLSYLSKGVIAEKIPGISAALVSGYGYMPMRRVDELDENGQPKRWTIITRAEYKKEPGKYSGYKVYDNDTKLFSGLEVGDYYIDDLKDTYPKYDDQGKFLGYFTETILPAHYKEQAGGKVIDSLANMVSSRIPWDDKHQAVVQEQVDTLPAYLGSIMVTADKVLEKSGSDFDGDKLFVSIADTYVNEDGKRVPYGTATSDDNKFWEYVLWQTANNKLFRDTINERLTSDSDWKAGWERLSEIKELRIGLDRLFGKELPFIEDFEGKLILSTKGRKEFALSTESSDIVDTLEDIRQAYIRQTLSAFRLPFTPAQFIAAGEEDLNNGVLNNRILNQKIALLSNEHISGGDRDAIINQATDTSPIKDLVDPGNSNSIIALLKEKGVPEDAPVMKQLMGNSRLDINTLSGMAEVFDSAMEGKENIGAAIISVMTGGFLQQHGIKGSGIEFNGKEYNDFGPTTTEDGQRKLAAVSAIANTMTDNLKDGNTVSKLGLSIEATGIVSTMVMQGVPLKDAVMYILQPAARSYFKQLKDLSGNIKTADELNRSSFNLLQKMMDAITKGASKEELKEYQSTMLTQDALLDNIATDGADKKLQYAVLRDLQAITKEVDVLSDINKVMQMAKGYPASWEDMDSINDSLNKLGIVWDSEEGRYVADNEFTGPIDVRSALLDSHDIYSTYIQKSGQDRELMKGVFLERTELFQRMKELVYSNMSVQDRYRKDFDKQLKLDLMSYLSIRSYINWLKGRGYTGTLKSLNHGMIYDSAKGVGQESIVDTVKRLRSSLKGQKKNFLINKFLRLVEAGTEGSNNINKAESNTWAKLSEHQQQLLQDSFTQLYSDPKTHDDANALFNYLLVKDGGQFKSGSFINYIPVFAFKDLFDRTAEVNKLLAQEDYSENKGQGVFGTDYEQLLNDFMTSYATHTNSKFYVPKISVHMTAAGKAPIKADLNKMTIDLFGDIRESLPLTGEGISPYKGKAFDEDEKEAFVANKKAIAASGFNIITTEENGKKVSKIEFPYSVKIGDTLYVLKSIDKAGKETIPSRLIQRGEVIPQGIRAYYQRQQWRGSRAQWKGAGVFGPVPIATVTPGIKKVENPPAYPDSPKQKDVTTEQVVANTPTNEPVDSNQHAVQQLTEKGIVTRWNADKNRWDFYNGTEMVANTYSANGPQEYYNHITGTMNTEQDIVSSQQEDDELMRLANNLPPSDDELEQGMSECFGTIIE